MILRPHKFDVCVEYGHVYADRTGLFDDAQLCMSAHAGSLVADKLARLGISVRRVVLYDDDLVAPEFIMPSAKKLLSKLAEKHQPDFLCFEHRLQSCSRGMDALVGKQEGARLAKEILHYSSKHGAYACSHNVALWHLYRLGLLSCSDQTACWRVEPWEAVAAEAFGSAQIAVSILDPVFMESEDRADREVLSKCEREVRDRIIRFCIDPVRSTNDDSRYAALVQQIQDALLKRSKLT